MSMITNDATLPQRRMVRRHRWIWWLAGGVGLVLLVGGISFALMMRQMADENIPPPDLVLYLQSPTEVLKKRLKERARRDDTATGLPALDDDYLRELNEAYNHFFFHYQAAPLLVVETSSVDVGWGDEVVDDLLKQVKAMTGGTRYYVPR